MGSDKKLAVVAVGGNALIRDPDHQTIPHQYEAALLTVQGITDMIEAGWNVIVTHGNGPQMGYILRRSELAIHEVAPVPMDYAGADLQGALGYMFVRAFRNEFRKRGISREPVAVVTEMLVDADDPAFREPTKPIGSHMDEATAKKLAAAQGWTVKDDAGRGWRRVVPSPRPRKIIDYDAIAHLARSGFVVIGCGGGGIPVVEEPDGMLRGVEAVIDKDLTAALLAEQLQADRLLILTDVPYIELDWQTASAMPIGQATPADLREHVFAAGSMAPKVEAACRFAERTGGEAVIGALVDLAEVAAGRTGTRVCTTRRASASPLRA